MEKSTFSLETEIFRPAHKSGSSFGAKQWKQEYAASPARPPPTMLFHGEMKNKYIRKIQFGGWTKRRYKEIRRIILKEVFNDEDVPSQ